MLLRVGHGTVAGAWRYIKPTFRERDHAVAGHDKMVDDPHIHPGSVPISASGQDFIGPRRLSFPEGGLWATASRGIRASAPDHFSGIDAGLGQGANSSSARIRRCWASR